MISVVGLLLGLSTAVPVQPIARDSVVETVIVELQIGRINTRTVEAYRLGVRSYLIKPTGFDALAAILRNLDLPWALT